jgi:hypothetical protein
MNTYNLPIDWDAMQKITAAVLIEDLDSLRTDWNTVYGRGEGMVFSREREEDLAEMSRHIQAFKMLIKYYGGTVK